MLINNEIKDLSYETPKDNVEDPQDKAEVKAETPMPWTLEFMSVSFDRLKQLNDQTVGWIKVEGTNINYPVVQAADNEFYLTNTFYKRKSIVGWIFADYRNNMDNLSFNTIIYGHSELLNNSMFTSLVETLTKAW